MLLDNVKKGDLVILSDGSQALIYYTRKTSPGRFYIIFDREVVGWVNERKSREWYYNGDGSFATQNSRISHVDIVKAVHND